MESLIVLRWKFGFPAELLRLRPPWRLRLELPMTEDISLMAENWFGWGRGGKAPPERVGRMGRLGSMAGCGAGKEL